MCLLHAFDFKWKKWKKKSSSVSYLYLQDETHESFAENKQTHNLPYDLKIICSDFWINE